MENPLATRQVLIPRSNCSDRVQGLAKLIAGDLAARIDYRASPRRCERPEPHCFGRSFLGPTLGGAMAEYTTWRLAFVVLVAVSIGIAALVPRALRETNPDRSDREAFPAV